MTYKIVQDETFIKDLEKLDKHTQKQVLKWIDKNLVGEDPRAKGKALVGNLKGYWRYRIENYRLLVKIQDNELVIIAVYIKHRSEVYKKVIK